MVNLLYNQSPPSEKARSRLIAQLDHESRVVSPSRAMQIFAGLDDEGLRAHALQRNSSAHQWNYWGVTRAQWPVEEWIWNYVVHPEGW